MADHEGNCGIIYGLCVAVTSKQIHLVFTLYLTHPCDQYNQYLKLHLFEDVLGDPTLYHCTGYIFLLLCLVRTSADSLKFHFIYFRFSVFSINFIVVVFLNFLTFRKFQHHINEIFAHYRKISTTLVRSFFVIFVRESCGEPYGSFSIFKPKHIVINFFSVKQVARNGILWLFR